MFEKINELKQKRIPFIIALITETKGSTPRKPGSKLLITAENEFFGTIGGGDLEFQVIEIAKKMFLENTQTKNLKFQLHKDLKMACGGYVQIYMEKFLPENQLIIFGAGHIGKFLAKLGNMLNFKVILIDERENIFSDLKENKIKIFNENFKSAIGKIKFDAYTYICSVAHTHNLDLEVAKQILKKEFAYFGIIASKNKASKIKKALKDYGFTENLINKIDMPMGLDINVETPQEIAISIIGKIIDLKNNKLRQ